MKVWFLTGNEGKVREAKKIFNQYNFQLEQMNLDYIEPQVDSIEEVAKEKMKQAIPYLPGGSDALFVEDAGLFVDALNDFPGVYSSYVLRTIGCQGIIRLLQHLRSEDPNADSRLRKARFEAVSGVYFQGKMEFFNGICPGKISHKEFGKNGFGFDPIFVPSDLDIDGNPAKSGDIGVISTHGETFGQISSDDKEKYSHRAKAVNKAISWLENQREHHK